MTPVTMPTTPHTRLANVISSLMRTPQLNCLLVADSSIWRPPLNTGQQRLFVGCRFRIFWQTDSGNSGRLGVISQALFKLKVTGPVGRSVEVQESPSLEDSIEDGSSQILVV